MKLATVIPCYKAKNTIEGVISDVMRVSYYGEKPGVIAVVDGDYESRDVLSYLQKERGKPDVIIFYGDNGGKTEAMKQGMLYLIGEKPEEEVLEAREVKGPDIFTYIDSDGQQSFSELFLKLVPELERADFSKAERLRPIKMPEKRIILESYVNRIVVEALRRMGYPTDSLLADPSEHMHIGPDDKVRDLQNNTFFHGRYIKDVVSRLFGKRYTFELELTLYAVTKGMKIAWKPRRDYGRPGILGRDWISVWKEHTQEKLYALKMHTGISENDLNRIVKDVTSGAEEDFIREIFS